MRGSIGQLTAVVFSLLLVTSLVSTAVMGGPPGVEPDDGGAALDERVTAASTGAAVTDAGTADATVGSAADDDRSVSTPRENETTSDERLALAIARLEGLEVASTEGNESRAAAVEALEEARAHVVGSRVRDERAFDASSEAYGHLAALAAARTANESTPDTEAALEEASVLVYRATDEMARVARDDAAGALDRYGDDLEPDARQRVAGALTRADMALGRAEGIVDEESPPQEIDGWGPAAVSEAHAATVPHYRGGWTHAEQAMARLEAEVGPSVEVTDGQAVYENGTVELPLAITVADVRPWAYETATVTTAAGENRTADLRVPDDRYGNATGNVTLDLGPDPADVTATVTVASEREPERRVEETVAVAVDEDEIEGYPNGSTRVDVSVDRTSAPVEAGETVLVDATVTNEGDGEATRRVALEVNGTERDATTVTLDGGANASVSLAWRTDDGDAGTHAAVVRTEDDADEVAVVVAERDEPDESFLAITHLEEPTSVEPGSTFDVTATVENVGDEAGAESTAFDGDGVDCERQVGDGTLPPGERATITASCALEEGADGDVAVEVDTGDDALSTTIPIDDGTGDGNGTDGGPAEPFLDITVEDERTITLVAGPRNFEEGLSTALPSTERAVDTGIAIEAVDLELAEPDAVSMRLSQRETLEYADAPESGVAEYLEIAHTPLEDGDVERFALTVAVDEARIDDPDRFAFLRYEMDERGWTDLETEHLGTDERNGTERFVVESPGLSAFAIVTDRRAPADARIDGVELANAVDVQDNGRYNDFDLSVRADTDVGPTATPFYGEYLDEELIAIQPVSRDRNSTRTLEVPQHLLAAGGEGDREVRVVLYEGDRYHGENASEEWTALDEWSTTVAYEKASGDVTPVDAARNSISVSTGAYEYHRQTALNSSHWQQCADGTAEEVAAVISDELVSQAEEITLQDLDTERTAASITEGSAMEYIERSGEAGKKTAKRITRAQQVAAGMRTMLLASFLMSEWNQLAECYTVSLHQESPGYNAREYAQLHENLAALEENAEELEATDDEAREQALLAERLTLLEDTYAVLPDYLEGTHSSAVEQAVERADLNAYEITSYFVEDLRLTLLEDHTATAMLLEEDVDENLTEDVRMPVHGWTLQHSLQEELAEEFDARTSMSSLTTKVVDGGLSAVDGRLLDTSERLGSFVMDSVTGREPFPDADEFGESRVYGTMDRYDDYVLYRVGFDEEKLERESASVSIVRPTHENVAPDRFDVTVMSERPQRVQEPNESIVLDVEPSAADGYVDQQFDFDPDQETYYVLVEANGTTDHYRFIANAERSGTTVDIVAKDGPNVLRPEIRLEDAPEPVDLRTGETVHATDDETVPLRWHAWDAFHDPEELEYQYRTLDPTGAGEWSPWTTVEPDGTIEETLELSEGYQTVQLVVRDGDGLLAVTGHTVLVDTTTPQIDVSSVGGPDSSLVEVFVDERVDEVVLEYRDRNATDGEWRPWTTISNVDDRDTISFNRDGHYELRGRATDFVGHESEWDETDFVSRVTVVEHEPGDSSTSTTGGVSSSWSVNLGGGSGGGSGGGGGGSGGGTITIGGSGGGGASNVEAAVEDLDGDLVMDVYVATREFPRVKVESIEFEETGSQEVNLPIPEDLGATTEITLEFRGEGRAQLRNINVTSRENPVEVDVAEPVVVDEPTTLEAVLDEEIADRIDAIEWDLDDDGTIDARGETTTHAFADTGTHPVSVTITDVFGKSTTETAGVVVGEPPAVGVDGPDRIDAGERASFVATDLEDEHAIERFEWDLDGDGAADATGRTVTRSWTDVGEQAVTLRVTDGRGATATASHGVAVESTPPAADVRVRTGEPMAGEPVSVSADRSTDEGEIVDYEWTVDGEPVSADGETADVTFASPGAHEVSVTVTDEHGETDAAAVTVSVREPVVVSLDGPSEATVGNETTVEATLRSGENVSLDWDLDDDGAYDDDSGTVVTPTFDVEGTHAVSVLATDANGTTDSARLEIDATNPAGGASFSVGTAYPTVGEPTTFELDREPRANESYEWTIAGETDTGPTATHSFDERGSHDATLVVSHEDGPAREFTRTVDVIAAIEPTITYNEPVVADESVQLAATESGPAADVDAYEWDLDGDGEVDATGETVTRTFETVGPAEVTLRVTDRSGTAESATETIDVREQVGVTIDGPEEAIVRTNVTVEATLESGADVAYAWDLTGDGTFDDASGERATARFETEGTATVSVRAESETGVVDEATHEIAVDDPIESAAFSIGSDWPLTNESVSFELDRDPRANESYEWTIAGETDTGPTATHSFDERGTYEATLEVSHEAGISEETSRDVDVFSPPRADVDVDEPAVVDEPVTLAATNVTAPDADVDAFAWDLTGDGEFDAEGASTATTFDEAGAHEVTLQVTDEAGVHTNTTTTVRVYEPPTVDVDVDEPISIVHEPTLEAIASAPGDREVVEYDWALEDGSVDGSGDAVTAAFDEPGTHEVGVTVTDDVGATNSTTETVRVYDRPRVDLAVEGPAYVNRPIAVDAAVEAPKERSVDDYEWRVGGNGSVERGEVGNATIVVGDDGTYTVSLAVTDDLGATSVANATVDAEYRPGDPVWWMRPGNATNVTAPTVVDGTVYAGTERVVPDENGSAAADDAPVTVTHGVAALGAADGDGRWHERATVLEGRSYYRGGLPQNTAPTVVDGDVYVWSGERLWSVTDETGTVRWSHERVSFTPTYGFTVANDAVYVAETRMLAASLSTWSSPASKSGPLTVLDADTGQRLWEDYTEGATSRPTYSAPTLVDGRLYVGDADGGAIALNATNGDTAWRTTWNVTGAEAVIAAPAVSNATAHENATVSLTTALENESAVVALDADTGVRRWNSTAVGTAAGTPTIAGDTLYVASANGTHALDANTGEHRWTVEAAATATHSPTVADDTLYVTGDDGVVSALETDTGDVRWRTDDGPVAERLPDATYATAPIVVDGTLYVGDRNGTVHAVATERYGDADHRSDGSRVATGTGNHHEEWTDRAGIEADVEPVSIDPASPDIHTGETITFDLDRELRANEMIQWRVHQRFEDGVDVTYNGTSITHTFEEAEAYAVEAHVVHDHERVPDVAATAYVQVFERPTARIDHDAPHSIAHEIELDGGSSGADLYRDVESYEWDVDGDGTGEETGETVSASFDEPGTHEVSLTVTDDLGGTDETTETVRVYDRPRVDLAVDGPAYVNRPVTIDADVTLPENRSVDSLEWAASEGATVEDGSSSDASVVGSEPGTHTISLAVTDDLGATSVANVTVDATYRPGDPVWSTAVGNATEVSAPTVVGDGLYVHAQTDVPLENESESEWRAQPSNGSAAALDVADGDVRWHRSTASEDGRYGYVTEGTPEPVPTTVGDTAYVSSGGSVRALATESGDERWVADDDAAVGWAVLGQTVANGTVYASGYYDGGVVAALDARTGDQLWNARPLGGVGAEPTIVDDRLYVSSYDAAAGLNATSGELAWRTTWNATASGPTPTAPAVADTAGHENATVYLTTDLEGESAVVALDANTGESRWNSTAVGTAGTPTVADGRLYVASENGTHALDADSGEHRWSAETAATANYSPTVAGDTLYVTGDDGVVSALDANTGDVRWRTDDAPDVEGLPDGYYATTPTVVGETLFVGDRNGTVHALAAWRPLPVA